MSKTPHQLYKERVKRIDDAIQLKVPDRVPVALSLGYFPAKYAGITCADAFYSPAKWKEAASRTLKIIVKISLMSLEKGEDLSWPQEALSMR